MTKGKRNVKNKDEAVTELSLFEIASRYWKFNSEESDEKDKSDDDIWQVINIVFLKFYNNTTINSNGIRLIENIDYNNVNTLEQTGYLEKYLLPNFLKNQNLDIKAKKSPFYKHNQKLIQHAVSIAILTNFKLRQGDENVWDMFQINNGFFDFNILIHILLKNSLDNPSHLIKAEILEFLTFAVESLEYSFIRKSLGQLFAISIWKNILPGLRNRILNSNPNLNNLWTFNEKKFNSLNDIDKENKIFYDSWLTHLLAICLKLVESPIDLNDNYILIKYLNTSIAFFISILSQLPTRRFTNTLLKDSGFLPAIKVLFPQTSYLISYHLIIRLEHLMFFPINDFNGNPLNSNSLYNVFSKKVWDLKIIAYNNFKSDLMLLYLSHLGAFADEYVFYEFFANLHVSKLRSLMNFLGLRTDVFEKPTSRQILLKIIFMSLESINGNNNDKKLYAENNINILELHKCFPIEKSLYNHTIEESFKYDALEPKGSPFLNTAPKLRLQFLSYYDFLIRSYTLFSNEFFYTIKSDIEAIINRLSPIYKSQDMNHNISNTLNFANKTIWFKGFSKMAVRLPSSVSILKINKPRLGEYHPSSILAEVYLSLNKFPEDVRLEWQNLKPGEVVFLVTAIPCDPKQNIQSWEKNGIKYLRCAEVVQVLDRSGKVIRKNKNELSESGEVDVDQYGRDSLRLQINLDTVAFEQDRNDKKLDIYDTFNLVIRRKTRENNFKAVLETINSIMKDIENQNDDNTNFLPKWLTDIYLGYGNPTSASFTNLSPTYKADFYDTFISCNQIKECFPNYKVTIQDEDIVDKDSFFTLEFETSKNTTNLDNSQEDNKLLVYPYNLQKPFPYEQDALKRNTLIYTNSQIEAICRSSFPGLSLIVGPPGTGKTDIAAQIISNLYHNSRNNMNNSERTLVITHSNQALNRLFEKLINLDLDQDQGRLLRLGHGEEALSMGGSYSQAGRIQFYLNIRRDILTKVDRLSKSIHAPGEHGISCETAGYFNQVYITPKIKEFMDKSYSSVEHLIDAFPFKEYFSDAPIPIFDVKGSLNENLKRANQCFEHLTRLFITLEEIRPFEVLRSPKEQANYLLLNQARVIAMTSTHAALRRREFIDLKVRYDNIIIEEAAQLAEIDSFIPLVMQRDNENKVSYNIKRLILIGDDLQNTPVIKNNLLRMGSNLNQSLFHRFLKLGVPHVLLDFQGRARSSIADIYRWRYKSLKDLDLVHKNEYTTANAGFKYEVQFIDCSDYQGTGESEPSPHFFQNLGEAEYAVSIFQYMRLLGYPNEKITILATYMGQKVLIQEILNKRCRNNILFGLPKEVSTVDQYQGEQNDYIILSLTRTKRLGYLRDSRRMTVAFSRARLGLYILGRKFLFELNTENKEFLSRIITRGKEVKLMLTEEMYPSKRLIGEKINIPTHQMEGVEHLGKYVYEMSLKKKELLSNNK